MIMASSSCCFVFVLLLLSYYSPFLAQAFLFPPMASSACSCPMPQCPAAPAAHCIWKRQSGGEEGENIASLVNAGEPERIDDDGANAGGGAGGQSEGIGTGQGDEMDGEDENSMGMVYDDELGTGAPTTERTTQSTAKLMATATSGTNSEIAGRSLESTIPPSSILPSIGTSSSLDTTTTRQPAIGNELKRGEGGQQQKKQQKEPLLKGKGGGSKSANATKSTAKIVPEKAGGNSSGNAPGQGTPKGANISRNCNSELMRQIMLEHINLKPTIAKRQIQAQVSAQLGGRIDVVCAKKAFSYIVNSELFCEVEKDGTICLCYRQQQA